jgi:hypothetical protein
MCRRNRCYCLMSTHMMTSDFSHSVTQQWCCSQYTICETVMRGIDVLIGSVQCIRHW